MTDHTIDPTGPLTIGTIPDADIDRMIEATIPAGTWRDITGLTPEQTDGLAKGGHLMTEADLLDMAHDYRDHNILQASLAHIPAPAGPTRASAWYHDGAVVTREVYGRRWRIGNVDTTLVGEQDVTGATAWHVEFDAVDHTVGNINAAQVREMAAALLVAADEMDGFGGNAYPVDSTLYRCCGGIGRHAQDCEPPFA